MIQLRFSTIEDSSKDKQFEIVDGEKIIDAVTRCLEGVPLGKFAPEQIFLVVVNGTIIPHEQWAVASIAKDDTVLIAPLLGDGDTGSIIKTALIIVITAIATVYLGPAVGGGVYGALAVAAVSVGSTLLLNALIPPPVPGGANALSSGSSYADSQMYAISNQSNTVKKFGTVPKVYGTHRMFPNIAATPYTELEADPDSDGYVEYLYAIYDFGLGVNLLSDIKIGDTPITSFTDVFYQLVDPNRPAVDEGVWDTNLLSTFTYFKSSAASDTFSISLDANQSENGQAYTYQAQRNTALNTTGAEETITLSFANAQGLYGVDTNGTRYNRRIALKIEFAEVGTDTWFGFNDYNYVKNYVSIGGESQYSTTEIQYYLAPNPITVFGYEIISYSAPAYQPKDTFGQSYEGHYGTNVQYGYARGSTFILTKRSGNLFQVGDVVVSTRVIDYYGNVNNPQFVGRIASLVYPADKSNYVELHFEQPIPRSLIIYEAFKIFPTPNITIDMIRNTTPDNINDGFGFQYPHRGPGYTLFLGQNNLYKGLPSNGIGYIEAQTAEAYYSTFSFTPINPKQYQVRVTRLTTTGGGSYQQQDKLTWQNVTTRFAVSPIATDKRHTFLELRIKATSQLSGSISNLSAICNSVLDVYDPTTQTWAKQVTNNPAWVFADMLTGEVNKRPVDKSRLDTTSLLAWRDYCDAVPASPASRTFVNSRFRTNFVLDYQTTLQDVVGQVANAAQASLSIIDGKYGVLLDVLKSVPVQIFTPRNSSGFTSVRSYTTRPDALNITFVDPLNNWSTSTIAVYDSGFDAVSAINFDELTTFACTNVEQAWRYGRYMLAQNRLRQETISITVDFEYLVCTRGDFVQITQDVMKVGGTPARVTSVNSARIKIDDAIVVQPGINYGYLFRSKSGTISQGTLTVVLADTFDLVGAIPQVGDLVIIGQVGQVVYDCLVKAITPTDDLKATLTLVEKADAIYTAESTDTFAEYNPGLNSTSTALTPNDVQDFRVLANSYRCNGTSYQYYVDIDWDIPLSAAPQYYEIYVDFGRGYNLITTTRDTTYEYIVDSDNLNQPHSFKVLAVLADGAKRDLAGATAVTATPLYKTARPADVGGLSIGITNEVLQLSWPKVSACDIDHYLIRYSPNTAGTWQSSVPLLTASADQTLASAQGRVGVYLIKAVDFNGNESTNAAEAITTIPNLFNLNIIKQIDDFPTLNGPKDQVQKIGSTLLLQNTTSGGVATNGYYSDGYYYFYDLLDLTDIFSVRLQALIQAEGITALDLMANWDLLSNVVALSNAGTSDWDVQAEYRSTNQINVISNWAQLSLINPISQGVQETYTPWRVITSTGDATGRIFQFRLHLISNRTSVTPRVIDAIIRADMPNRTDRYTGLTSSASGVYALNYPTSFRGPDTTPNVQVTINNAQAGDYYSYDYRTLSGLGIRFFNAGGTQVSRMFDIYVSGYGSSYSAVI